MNRKFGLIGIGALAALTTQIVMAGSLHIESAPLTAVHNAATHASAPGGMATWNQPVIRMVGMGEAKQITSKGRDIMLVQATKLIVPSGWSVYAGHAVQPDERVSWNAKNRPWTDVLGDAIKGENLFAVVDWNNRSVSFDVMAPVAPLAHPAAPLARPATLNSSAKPVVPAHQWLIPSGASMSDTVRGWGKSAGWQVVWNATDWVPDATSSVTGDFRTAVGQLVQAANRQNLPLTATFYSNNIVVFGNSNTALNK